MIKTTTPDCTHRDCTEKATYITEIVMPPADSMRVTVCEKHLNGQPPIGEL